MTKLKNRRKRKEFYEEWNKHNNHNKVVPIEIFPLDIVSVGAYSYGELHLLAYDENNKHDKLIIGNFVSISMNVQFLLHENHQIDSFTTFPLKTVLTQTRSPQDMIAKGSIIIEDEVWIGFGATIPSGVTIGKGAIISSKSVVTKDIPPYAIVGGVPAKIIRYRFEEEIIQRLLPLQLDNLSEEIILANLDLFYDKMNGHTLDKIEKLFN